MFGDDILKNGIHSSSNIEHAFEKISKIFGDEATKAAATEEAAEAEAAPEGGEGDGELEGETPAEAGEAGEAPTAEGGEGTGEEEKAHEEGGEATEQGGDAEEAEAEGWFVQNFVKFSFTTYLGINHS